MPRWETAGEIVHRRHNSLEWKVEERHFSAPHLASYVASPTFRFADHLWYLAKWPHDSKWVGLSLCGTNSQGPVLRVRLGVRRADGRNLRHCWGRTSPRGCFEVPRYLKTWQVPEWIAEVEDLGYIRVFCELSVEAPSLPLSPEAANGVEAARRDPNGRDDLTLYAGDKAAEKEKSEEMSGRLKSESLDRLLEDMKTLRENTEEHDITFVVRGEKISAHRLVLRARCPVFRSMFRHEMVEQASGVVEVDDCDPDSFRDLLSYIYAGSVGDMSPSGVFGLFAAADKYCLDELRKECLEFVRRGLCVDTFCDALELALRYAEDELLQLATEFFAEHIKDIIVAERWETFLRDHTAEGNKLFIKALVPEKLA